jgi:hypothetical protein
MMGDEDIKTNGMGTYLDIVVQEAKLQLHRLGQARGGGEAPPGERDVHYSI